MTLILMFTSIVALANEPVRIAMYGDSTIFGLTTVDGRPTQSTHNEPRSTEWALQRFYNLNVTVENKGVPGSMAFEHLWGRGDVRPTWAQEMKNSRADIVVMNAAINDAFRPWIRDEDFRYAYAELARIARENGKIFVIETANPIAHDSAYARLRQLADVQRRLAADLQIPLIDQLSVIVATNSNWAAFLSDVCHPGDALYMRKGEIAGFYLAPIVRQFSH